MRCFDTHGSLCESQEWIYVMAPCNNQIAIWYINISEIIFFTFPLTFSIRTILVLYTINIRFSCLCLVSHDAIFTVFTNIHPLLTERPLSKYQNVSFPMYSLTCVFYPEISPLFRYVIHIYFCIIHTYGILFFHVKFTISLQGLYVFSK